MKLPAPLLLSALPALAAAGQAHMPPANPHHAPPPKGGFSYRYCDCIESAGRPVEIGETAPWRSAAGRMLARCAFSVSVPAWRPEAETCPGV